MDEMVKLLQDYTFQVVAVGTGVLGLLSGLVGSFAMLRRESLLGDAMSHAALPGIVISFLVTGDKNVFLLLLGAAISGLLAAGLIRWLSEKNVKLDSALSLVLSAFFGLGLVLLTVAQKRPNANQAGLESFIYGQASSMLLRDAYAIIIVAVVIITLTGLFWKEIKMFTFDQDFARTQGYSVFWLQVLLTGMLVAVVILGLESVGVILMSALLIAPPVAARQWTKSLAKMTILSGIIGAIAGAVGTVWSSAGTQMPTGPAIVIVASGFVVISILFAPQRGLLAKGWRYSVQKRKYLQSAQANQQQEGVAD